MNSEKATILENQTLNEQAISNQAAVEQRFSEKFSFLNNIHPLAVVFFIIAMVAISTYLIPGGAYDRVPITVIGLERETIIPGSFHYVQSIPQSFFAIWTSFMKGAIEASDVSFTIFLCAGAYTAIIATGALNNGINSLARMFAHKSMLLIPIFVFAFGLGGATYGMYEDAIPFILIICPLMLAIGYDSMVGVMTVHFSVAVGSSAAILNPFSVGVAQALSEVPMMSGAGVRVVLWIVMMMATSAYIMFYAQKVKKSPELSLSYNEDKLNRKRYSDFSTSQLESLSLRDTIVLLLTFGAMAFMIYGVIRYGWWFNEIGSLFMFMGIVIPLVGGLSVGEMINKNVEGMTTVISAVLLISASRVITAMLIDSHTMDTILNFISGALGDLPQAISVIVMYFVSGISMIFIQSSSGCAATLMPIMAPLADMLGITRQTVVSAFSLGSFGWIVPWEGINFAMCSLAGVSYFKYLRKATHYMFTVYVPLSLITLVLMTIFKYQ